MVSLPAPAVIVSAPPAPSITFASSDPVMVSVPPVAMTFSMLVNVSLPAVEPSPATTVPAAKSIVIGPVTSINDAVS